jgi:hypothetical protein
MAQISSKIRQKTLVIVLVVVFVSNRSLGDRLSIEDEDEGRSRA